MSDRFISVSAYPQNQGPEQINKMEKLRQFHEMNSLMKSEGMLYCQALKDIQETLQGKELIETCKAFGPLAVDESKTAAQNPLDGHKISD